jgi:hypothetical protein
MDRILQLTVDSEPPRVTKIALPYLARTGVSHETCSQFFFMRVKQVVIFTTNKVAIGKFMLLIAFCPSTAFLWSCMTDYNYMTWRIR